MEDLTLTDLIAGLTAIEHVLKTEKEREHFQETIAHFKKAIADKNIQIYNDQIERIRKA